MITVRPGLALALGFGGCNVELMGRIGIRFRRDDHEFDQFDDSVFEFLPYHFDQWWCEQDGYHLRES